MNDENPDETIGLLTSNSSVWGIRSSPLTFAYENLMYDVVAHTCLKKYMRKKLYNNLATDIKSFFKVRTKKTYNSIANILTSNEGILKQGYEGNGLVLGNTSTLQVPSTRSLAP